MQVLGSLYYCKFHKGYKNYGGININQSYSWLYYRVYISRDTIFKKVKIQSFKDNILKIFAKILVKYLMPNLSNFKAQCEDLVKKSCVDYNKIIDQL